MLKWVEFNERGKLRGLSSFGSCLLLFVRSVCTIMINDDDEDWRDEHHDIRFVSSWWKWE